MNRCKQLFALVVFGFVWMSFAQNALAVPLELSMEESISLALKNNHDVHYAKAAKEKYYWALQQAKKIGASL